MTQNTIDPGRLMAHRGSSMVQPENTLAAIREADRQGAHWIEFDVSLLGDGTPVVHHDATLDRRTNRSGLLSDLTADDLDGIDAGNGERLPTLQQVLDVLDELGMFANLEMKPHDVPPAAMADVVAQALRGRAWAAQRIITSSFNLQALTALRLEMPEAPIAVLFNEAPGDWVNRANDIGAAALHLNFRHLSQSLLRTAQSHGIDVRVFTINDPALLVPFRDLGLSGVITDHPPLFLDDPDWAAWIRR